MTKNISTSKIFTSYPARTTTAAIPAKIEVTVNVSPDGFLGYDPDAIAKIDQDASRSMYCDAVRKEVSGRYPELDLTFEFRDATCAYEGDIEDDVIDGLTDIESEIYDAGMFWVDK